MHRAFWVSKKTNLVTSKGQNVGAVYGFLRSLKKHATDLNSDAIYVVWDKKLKQDSTNFRYEKSQGQYKGQRKHDKELYMQVHILTPILESLGIKNMYPYVMEGDDVIAWLTQKLDGEHIIVSVDQDFYQLISPETSLYNINKKMVINVDNFESTVGIESKYFLRYKAILGDISDNMPGIVGYGKVRAKKLARKWNIQRLLKEDQELIYHNLELMDLTKGYTFYDEETESYEQQLETLIDLEPDIDKFKQYCEEYEFNGILKKFKDWSNTFDKSTRLSFILNAYFNK